MISPPFRAYSGGGRVNVTFSGSATPASFSSALAFSGSYGLTSVRSM